MRPEYITAIIFLALGICFAIYGIKKRTPLPAAGCILEAYAVLYGLAGAGILSPSSSTLQILLVIGEIFVLTIIVAGCDGRPGKVYWAEIVQGISATAAFILAMSRT